MAASFLNENGYSVRLATTDVGYKDDLFQRIILKKYRNPYKQDK
jgi:hypothetical protein